MTQFKKEVANFRVNKLALAVALGLSLGLTGCDDDKGVSNAVGVPNPNALMPTGTIQGTLVDAVTNEPIVGAVVDIGIAKATTSETGQFVISNVPATTTNLAPAGAVGSTGAYDVTIDLRQVKAAASGAKYPDFSYSSAAVSYTTLADGTGASSNHATPVTGLVAPISLTVGKLAAGIKGVVAKTSTFKAAGAGYTVKLVSIDGCGDNGTAGITPGADGCNTPLTGANTNGSATSGKGGTGANEHVVAMVTTKEDGAFSFEKIESLQLFRIDVVNADGTERGSERVKSPADDQIKTLLIQRGGLVVPVADGALLPADDAADLRTVFVSSTDTLAPRVLTATPENGSEIAPGSNVTVKFAFSEPILQTAATKGLTPSSAAGSLYNLIQVNFLGAKAGNIAHSLSWNATFTELTVTIPTVAAASNYQVDLRPAVGILQDVQQNPIVFDAAKNEGLVNFTTNGAITPKNVSTLRVPNSGTLDVGINPILDWNAVSGAKSYNVYRAKSLTVAADGTATYGAFERIANTITSDYIDNLVTPAIPATATTAAIPAQGLNETGVILAPYTGVDFAENDVKVSYKYMVRPVSRDNVESVDTTGDVANTIEARDVHNNAASINGFVVGATSVTVNFSEQMDKVSARNIANYVLTARADDPTTTVNEAPATTPAFPALSSVVYDAFVSNTATLTYASGIPAGTTLTVNVKDIAGNSVVTGAAATNTASTAKVVASINYFGGNTATVAFTAEMNKADAELIANYTLATTTVPPVTTPPTTNAVVTAATLSANNRVVTLTFDKALSPATTLTVKGIKDSFGTVADGVSTKVVGP